jgi:hypothetical protein
MSDDPWGDDQISQIKLGLNGAWFDERPTLWQRFVKAITTLLARCGV